MGLSPGEEAAVLWSRCGWSRGTETMGCGSGLSGGSKASVLSYESREVFQSMCFLGEDFRMDPAPPLLPSHVHREVAAASQQLKFLPTSSRGAHPCT